MIKIAVCDDNKASVDYILALVKQYQHKDKYEVYGFYSSVALLESIYDGNMYNILFMDINLEENGKEIMGTDIASMIKKLYPEMLIIYISYYDYYREMVQAEPFKFLNKPIEENDFNKVMDAAYERLKAYNYRYTFNNEIYIVNLREVYLFRSEHRKIYIKKRNGEEVYFYGKLDLVEKEIESICHMFARASKSYLVNVCYVGSVTKNYITVDNERITLTRNYKMTFYKQYLNKIIHFAR